MWDRFLSCICRCSSFQERLWNSNLESKISSTTPKFKTFLIVSQYPLIAFNITIHDYVGHLTMLYSVPILNSPLVTQILDNLSLLIFKALRLVDFDVLKSSILKYVGTSKLSKPIFGLFWSPEINIFETSKFGHSLKFRIVCLDLGHWTNLTLVVTLLTLLKNKCNSKFSFQCCLELTGFNSISWTLSGLNWNSQSGAFSQNSFLTCVLALLLQEKNKTGTINVIPHWKVVSRKVPSHGYALICSWEMINNGATDTRTIRIAKTYWIGDIRDLFLKLLLNFTSFLCFIWCWCFLMMIQINEITSRNDVTPKKDREILQLRNKST